VNSKDLTVIMTEPLAEDEQENLTAVTAVVDDSNLADVPNLKGDWHNIIVLLLLYTMQGIGVSLTIAVPIILQGNKNVTYKYQVDINKDLILMIVKLSRFRINTMLYCPWIFILYRDTK